MAASPYDGVVGHRHPSAVFDGMVVKVSRVVMVAPDEQYPIVVVGQTLAVPHIHILVIALLFKAETAVSGHNDQGVGQAILDAAFVDEQVEVAVYVPTHDDSLCFRELVDPFVAIHTSVFKMMSVACHANMLIDDEHP